MRLTVEIHHSQIGWVHAADLIFRGQDEVTIEYDLDHATRYLGRKDWPALSLTFPVSLEPYSGPVPGFLIDLIPQGRAIMRLLRRHGIKKESDFSDILSKIPLASPGNIRIREPWERIESLRPTYDHPGFAPEDILHARHEFIEYMERHGAPVGGTSGAAGGAPKFLLREDAKGKFHADGYLDDTLTRSAYLIKFPFTDSENSKLLIRTEKAYYDLLRHFPLTTGAPIELKDDILFISRFDRIREVDGHLHYYGLESLYSSHGIGAYGVALQHEDNLELIKRVSTDWESDVIEYVLRDVVNQSLANTDNHGRNTSLIKRDNEIRLSPLYDVTAMKFFEGDFIIELTRWRAENQEMDARRRWLVDHLMVSEDRLDESLKVLKNHLGSLEELLHETGVPLPIIERGRKDRDQAFALLALY